MKIIVFLAVFLLVGVFGFFAEKLFVLISAPKAIAYFASLDEKTHDVSLSSTLTIIFNKPIKRKEISPVISPEVNGQWTFEGPLALSRNHFFTTLVFRPAIGFETGTEYQVKIENIKGFGRDTSSSYSFDFKTQTIINEQDEQKEKITLLDIPLDWQDHKLSCEAASLKMALAQKKVYLSEEDIMEKIGYDLTPRKKNIWGDAYQVFVGDIDGKICETGFGVFWPRVGEAANFWRPSQSFTGWRLGELIEEIQSGNPVIIWGVLPVANPTNCSWSTPNGKYIKAFKETHARLAVGFVGPAKNPSQIILNDSLAGQIYWPVSYFLENWGLFNNSGVVVR